MIDSHLIFPIFILLAGLAVLFYLQTRRFERTLEAAQMDESRELLLQWLGELRAGIDRNTEMVNQQLAHANDTLNQRLESTTQLLLLLNKDLGQVHQVGEQMRDFQQFFRSPKLRGRIGEQIMAEILQQVLPRSSFALQHRFKSGAIVDALITLEGGSIAVDAKFPLENFQKAIHAESTDEKKNYMVHFRRDVLKHAEAIHKKYIQPEEGTLDFAVMYVPSETLYYEIITNDALVRETERRNVLIVSPNSFFFFLKLLLVGLFNQQIEQRAAEVLQHLKMLQRENQNLSAEMNTLLTHLNNARNSAERLHHNIKTIGTRLASLGSIENEE